MCERRGEVLSTRKGSLFFSLRDSKERKDQQQQEGIGNSSVYLVKNGDEFGGRVITPFLGGVHLSDCLQQYR